MSDETSFVDEIRASPDDITPRLIYADFLEDAGDPRGELIRVQCELSLSQPGDPARPALYDRERALLDKFADQWLQPLRALGAEGVSRASFRGGLLERVRIQLDRFLDTGHELCEQSPALTRLELRKVPPLAAEMAKFPLPDQITELDLSAGQIDAACLQTLAEAQWLPQIRILDVQLNRFEDDGVAALISGAWSGLQTLNLASNQISMDGAQYLASWQQCSKLRRLDLRMNPIADPGLRALLAAQFESLEQLNLAFCDLQSIAPLTESTNVPRLGELIVRNNSISRQSMELFEVSPVRARLKTFDARGNG